MTLTSTIVKDQYNGTGAQTAFPTTYVFWEADDLQVIHTDALAVETIWVRGTQYTVTGGNGSTGTVNVSTSPTDYTPASGTTLTIISNLADTQPTSLPAGGPFPSTAVELRFDQLVRLIQQRAEEIGRAIKLSVTSALSAITIPDPENGKFLRGNATNDGFENVTITGQGSIGLPVAVTDGGTGAITEAAARTALGLEIGTDVQADLDVPSQAEAEAGTATTERVWTAQRVAQAATVIATLPKNYLTGLQLSQAADTDHDITVSVGECRGSDDDEDIALASALTKQIDATWAAGDAAGGLSSSLTAPANNTWHHVHAIMVGGSADVGFDTSVTAANLVTDHSATAYRRLGSVLTDGSANIIGFSQLGDEFLWATPTQDNAGTGHAPTGSRSLQAMSTPLGIKVRGIFRFRFQGTATSVTPALHLSSPDTTDVAATFWNSVAGHTDGATDGGQFGEVIIRTDTSSQIGYRSNTASLDIHLGTIGWIDDRGRND